MRRLFASIVFLFVLVPVVASAATAAELQAQLADLLARVAALNQQLGITAGTNTGQQPIGGVTANIFDGSTPLQLSRDIAYGASGADVSALQTHLAKDPTIYPEGIVSGSYRNLTVEAVKRFQIKCGIVTAGTESSTGYGRVGPLTRKALALGCQNANVPAQVGALIKINPVSGNAPLTVNANVTVNTPQSCDAATYALDFGDGTAPTLIPVPLKRCSQVVQDIPHTYARPGTYNAILYIGTHKTTVTVTVTGNGQATTTATTQTPGTYTTSNVPTTNAYNTIPSNAALQIRFSNPTTFISRGSNIIVSWDAVNAPPGAAVRLELRKTDNSPVGGSGISSGNAASGQYVWQVPVVTGNVSCDLTKGQLCASSIEDGKQYQIRAYLYTPADSCWGYCEAGAKLPTVLAITNSPIFTINAAGAAEGDRFNALPTTGNTPLTVTFDTLINSSASCTGGVYTIDFGDNSAKTELPYQINNCASQTFSVKHIYYVGGTFIAKLYNMQGSAITPSSVPLKQQTIITSGTQGSFSITLGVAGVPNSVNAVFSVPAQSCTSYSVNWGDGTALQTKDAGTSTCANDQTTITLNHVYASNGTYTITLKRGQAPLSQISNSESAVVTITGVITTSTVSEVTRNNSDYNNYYGN